MAETVAAEDFAAILAQVRRFVRDEVVPREREIADTNAIPDDLRQQAAAMGLFGYAIPEEYGGLGLAITQDVELALELGYTTLAFRSMFGTNNGIAGQVLVGYGTDGQKKRWLEPMAEGRVVASFALTEPEAGSDPSGMRSTATWSGDSWTIDGQKRFITNAPIADLFVTFAKVKSYGTDDGRSRCSWCPPTRRAWVSAPRTRRWARRARPPPTSPSTVCGLTPTRSSAARCRPDSGPP